MSKLHNHSRLLPPQREIRIFTSANALPYLGPKIAPADLPKECGGDMDSFLGKMRGGRALLRDQFVFVGLPLTQVLHGRVNQTDAVSIQVSGSNTIFNTGIYDINAFDIVCWDVPMATTTGLGKPVKIPPGLPNTKQPFWTVPLRLAARDDTDDAVNKDKSITHCATEDIFHAVQFGAGDAAVMGKRKRDQRLTGAAAGNTYWDKLKANLILKAAVGGDDFDTALKSLLSYWSSASLRYHHRVIGFALSKARPGEQFDICLSKAF